MSFDDLSASQPAGWEWLNDEREMLEQQTAQAQDCEVMLLSERPAISDDNLVAIILGMDNHLIDAQAKPNRIKVERNIDHLTRQASSVMPFVQEKNFWE